MIEFVDSWGSKLFSVALLYGLVALVVTWGFVAAGLEPPPLVPRTIIDLYTTAASAYADFAQTVQSGDVLLIAFKAGVAMGQTALTVLGLLASIVTAYIWIAVEVTGALPGPLSVLSIPLWAGAVTAEAILLLYLIKQTMSLLQEIRSLVGA